jgi:hypothetical protein
MERRTPEDHQIDYWLRRDLQPDRDMVDEDGRYGTKFGELWLSDTEYEWPKRLDWYQESDAETRATINNVFVHLIGYTLPSLVDLAHGLSEDELPYTDSNPSR